MKAKDELHPQPTQPVVNMEGDALPGYPVYPPSEDIYHKLRKENDINPEDISTMKESKLSIKPGHMNELDFTDDVSGGDLDIPGSELDDDLEAIGCEDEENNYYSIGGDNHNDLEEHKGD